MTPDDIRSQRFGVRLLRGLSPEEVSAFLEDVAEAYGDVQKWNAVLVARVEKLEHEIQVLEARAKETSASTHIGMFRTVALREVEQWLATVDPRGRARGRRETLAMSNGDDESVSASDEVRAG